MKKKRTRLEERRVRSDELRQCEKTILEMFSDKHITVSEALFIFEKIKFAAFYGDMAAQVELHRRAEQTKPNQHMFR